MILRAEKFATVHNGIIVAITDATPSHELLPNQFELTTAEYLLLRAVSSFDEADLVAKIHRLADQIQLKLDKANNEES